MELLATNLANADTPNFKARDIDFREALAAAASWLDFHRRFWTGSLERLDSHLKRNPKEKKT